MKERKQWLKKSTAVFLAVWIAAANLLSAIPAQAALEENDAGKWTTNLEGIRAVKSDLTYVDGGLLVKGGGDAAAMASVQKEGNKAVLFRPRQLRPGFSVSGSE